MSRRPADKTKLSPAMDYGQQAVWAAIRKHRTFTINDIWDVVDMKRPSIANYVDRLERGGYLSCTRADRSDRHAENTYKLARDSGHFAPRLKADGSPYPPNATTNMWRAMRGLPTFTATDVQIHASTPETPVKRQTAVVYIRNLVRAGYVRVLRPSVSNGPEAQYKLVNNTGPQAPKIQRVKQVFDPNIGAVTPIQEGGQ